MPASGYKLFATGDVLTAAQVNDYLMLQTVMVFANSAARTSALSAVLAEGMVSYLQDTNVVEVYTGAAWVSLDDPNAIQNTIVDAKGDLIAASAADTPARLAVGTDGQYLSASSGAATGLAWATPLIPNGLTLQHTVTSTGTVTIPAATKFVYAVVVAGGGAGNAGETATGNGGCAGGAGGIAFGYVPAVSAVTVGAGGATSQARGGNSAYSNLYTYGGYGSKDGLNAGTVDTSGVYTYSQGCGAGSNVAGGAQKYVFPLFNSRGGVGGLGSASAGTRDGGGGAGFTSGGGGGPARSNASESAGVGGAGSYCGGGGGGGYDTTNVAGAGGAGAFAGGSVGAGSTTTAGGGGGGGGGYLAVGSNGGAASANTGGAGGAGGSGGGAGAGGGRGNTTGGTFGAGGNGCVLIYY